MGCGSSKAVEVIHVCSANNRPLEQANIKSANSERSIFIKEKRSPSLIPLPGKKNGSASSTNDSGIVSHKDNNDSDEISYRKNSISSNESGYLDNEYKNVITEKSKKEEIEKIEKHFVEKNNLDLTLTGKSCPPLLSKKEKEIKNAKEEQAALEMLKNNGLVQKPVVEKENYALFEIVAEEQTPVGPRPATAKNNLSPIKNLPPRLLQREKTKPTLTAEEIEEKLERANQRKQESLKAKALTSSISIERKHSDSYHKPDNRSQDAEFDREIQERERKLKELRDRLKAKGNDALAHTPRTPRSKELVSELDKFRPKTASNFRPDFN